MAHAHGGGPLFGGEPGPLGLPPKSGAGDRATAQRKNWFSQENIGRYFLMLF